MPGGGVGSIIWLMDNVFVGWILSWRGSVNNILFDAMNRMLLSIFYTFESFSNSTSGCGAAYIFQRRNCDEYGRQ